MTLSFALGTIPYIANPVDKDYQSLNVMVPIKVDDVEVDAANAPILFTIGVDGYVSVNNAQSGSGFSRAGTNADLALAAGYVVVSPGCRGRDNQAAAGLMSGCMAPCRPAPAQWVRSYQNN
jgi:hypothetical protein